MELKPGSRWRSTVDTTEVIVVRAPSASVELGCGGAPMAAIGSETVGGDLDPSLSDGTQLGKRYTDPEATLELLCTKAGQGTLTVDGGALRLVDAKPLPSSD